MIAQIFLPNEMFNLGIYRRRDKTAGPVLAEDYFDPNFEEKICAKRI